MSEFALEAQGLGKRYGKKWALRDCTLNVPTGSVAALVSHATGKDPYFVGKPNPLMMRSALNAIDAHSETTAMIGDRMDTDIVAGLEAGLETILVLTGVTSPADAERYPYRASRVVDSVADLVGAG